jgi:hypothetical protein
VKLLADEGVDAAIVTRLRSDGHDVVYVAELSPGITDEAVLELANANERILVTTDKDFGELVFRLRPSRALAGATLDRQGRCRRAGDRRARCRDARGVHRSLRRTCANPAAAVAETH